MNRIISAVLRLILVLGNIFSSYNTFHKLQTFERFHLMTVGQKVGTITILVLMINFDIYMFFNAYRDFKNRPIRLKFMYVIILITVLVALLSILPFEKTSTERFLVVMSFALLLIFFLINDFIRFWVKPYSVNPDL